MDRRRLEKRRGGREGEEWRGEERTRDVKKMRVMKRSTREERMKIRKREEEKNAGGRKGDEERTGDEWIKKERRYYK